MGTEYSSTFLDKAAFPRWVLSFLLYIIPLKKVIEFILDFTS